MVWVLLLAVVVVLVAVFFCRFFSVVDSSRDLDDEDGGADEDGNI